ncbi:hypothetical protein Purlil1_13479 [Purpureocillium lilacinum]|uniref:Phosphatidic acid phosphatase type 2/haloperoxidase domain-containing protein n=1 Tax=Purpureocillium lilacinum TaxID=33203 RepID=A0ABR0BDZ7_PURLI|nr:hypothetical protein Purlil1_13479 [Purpureocillium lilacinum]
MKSAMASILLLASYVFDWIILISLAGIGLAISSITPNKRPFVLDDPAINFPYKDHDTVSLNILFMVSVVAPAVIIVFIALLFVPGPTVGEATSRSYIWRRKLWEWHAGWLGLALSTTIAWFFTSGMKNLFGKPRPNALGRCQPDLANIARHLVSSMPASSKSSRFVSADICLNLDAAVVDEGFRSFPSGHASVSAAGLVYLSLLLASKLGAGVPHLKQHQCNCNGLVREAFSSGRGTGRNSFAIPQATASGVRGDVIPFTGRKSYQALAEPDRLSSSSWNQAAAPPIYTLVIPLVPFAAAIFVSCSRWYDFQHHGFDIISGFLIGALSAIHSFRYYHQPLSRGAGWAWGPRGLQRAFWRGIGRRDYSSRSSPVDREAGIQLQEWRANGTSRGNEANQIQSV